MIRGTEGERNTWLYGATFLYSQETQTQVDVYY